MTCLHSRLSPSTRPCLCSRPSVLNTTSHLISLFWFSTTQLTFRDVIPSPERLSKFWYSLGQSYQESTNELTLYWDTSNIHPLSPIEEWTLSRPCWVISSYNIREWPNIPTFGLGDWMQYRYTRIVWHCSWKLIFKERCLKHSLSFKERCLRHSFCNACLHHNSCICHELAHLDPKILSCGACLASVAQFGEFLNFI